VRRFGSAALDLAWTAAGRYDGYWELGIKKWDMAAGLIMVREAGGFATDPEGGDPYPEGNIVAGNQALHGKLREVVQDGIAAAGAARGRAAEAAGPPAAG
jgi:myo-inositol-1(or 4)-monophosphatase